jgi:hypothetical protein
MDLIKQKRLEFKNRLTSKIYPPQTSASKF